MVTRAFDVFDPVILSVGTFHAGTQQNVIPQDAVFEATVRSFSDAAQARVKDGTVEVCRGIAAAYGVGVDAEFAELYPVTVNDEEEYAFAKDTIVDLFGPDRYVHQRDPEMGAEDFAFVGQEVPSAYVNLSACPAADYASAPDNHSPRADFDDSVVPDGAALLAELALRRLRQLSTPGVANRS